MTHSDATTITVLTAAATTVAHDPHQPQKALLLAPTSTPDRRPPDIAGAANTPLLVIIAPADYKQPGPYQPKDNDVTNSLPCSPCSRTATFVDCERNQCLCDVKPHQVSVAPQSL